MNYFIVSWASENSGLYSAEANISISSSRPSDGNIKKKGQFETEFDPTQPKLSYNHFETKAK